MQHALAARNVEGLFNRQAGQDAGHHQREIAAGNGETRQYELPFSLVESIQEQTKVKLCLSQQLP